MHRGVRFLLCEIFNDTFPLLSVPLDVLIFVLPSYLTALSRSVQFAEVAVG
jgi:hypothetical protein